MRVWFIPLFSLYEQPPYWHVCRYTNINNLIYSNQTGGMCYSVSCFYPYFLQSLKRTILALFLFLKNLVACVLFHFVLTQDLLNNLNNNHLHKHREPIRHKFHKTFTKNKHIQNSITDIGTKRSLTEKNTKLSIVSLYTIRYSYIITFTLNTVISVGDSKSVWISIIILKGLVCGLGVWHTIKQFLWRPTFSCLFCCNAPYRSTDKLKDLNEMPTNREHIKAKHVTFTCPKSVGNKKI